jgi:hypothetical protein
VGPHVLHLFQILVKLPAVVKLVDPFLLLLWSEDVVDPS